MFTIKDLREGRCAVENSGNREDLKRVLNKAFPKYDKLPNEHYEYYYLDTYFYSQEGEEYNYGNESELPPQKVQDFMEEIWKPKFNDIVLVYGNGEWVERYFVATCSRGKHIVSTTKNGAFSAASTGFVDEIKEKPVDNTVTRTMDQIAELLGCDVKDLKITK